MNGQLHSWTLEMEATFKGKLVNAKGVLASSLS